MLAVLLDLAIPPGLTNIILLAIKALYNMSTPLVQPINKTSRYCSPLGRPGGGGGGCCQFQFDW
jgi:hypothetical protein